MRAGITPARKILKNSGIVYPVSTKTTKNVYSRYENNKKTAKAGTPWRWIFLSVKI